MLSRNHNASTYGNQ
jgi:hypothetical protein